MKKELLSPSQSAKIVGVTRPGFVKMVNRKEIKPAIEIGRLKFFDKQAVMALKEKRTLAAQAAGRDRSASGDSLTAGMQCGYFSV